MWNEETVDTSSPASVVTFVSSWTERGAVVPAAKQMGAVCYLNSVVGRRKRLMSLKLRPCVANNMEACVYLTLELH